MIGKTYVHTNEPTITALWRTLIANTYNGDRPAPHSAGLSFICWLVQVIHISEILQDPSKWPLAKLGAGFITAVQPSRGHPDGRDKSSKSRGIELKAAWERFVELHSSAEFPFKELMLLYREDGWTTLKLDEGFKDALNSVYHDRRLFLTEKGYLGVGPWTLQEGDSIMIAAGGEVPFVFRPNDKPSEHWMLMGEAYMHGLMYQEAFSTDKDIKFKMISIT